MKPIKTFVINLEDRIDRRANILKEFSLTEGFQIQIVHPLEHKVGAVSLWRTINWILKEKVSDNDDFILLCEDDHNFTKNFRLDALHQALSQARMLEADILLGGVSWFTDAIQISPDLFWIDKFSGLQFTIIFKKFFYKILEADFLIGDAADYKISELTDKKFVLYPFISTQKEFGYSDVTAKNNQKGRVTDIFKSTSRKLGHLDKVANYYKLIS